VKFLCLPCLILPIVLTGCTRRSSTAPLTPKAYGMQIVEVSGGKQISGVGAKLSDPLVLQVNAADGTPVVGAAVSVHGAGLFFNPPGALSDSNGQVSVAVQLGNIPGSYQIIGETPNPAGISGSVSVREIALGYQEKLGKEVTEKYCVVCHDPESTPERVSNFDNLAPPQPHLFSDGNALNSLTDGDLVKIISDGGPALGKSPQTPGYRGTLTAAQIKAIVAYMRAIADPPYQSPGAK
jgi:cbb3-type cytochrome c oxidase subunit III